MIEFATILARVKAATEDVSTPPRVTQLSFCGSGRAHPDDDLASRSLRGGGQAAWAAAYAAYPGREQQRDATCTQVRPAIAPDMRSFVDELRRAGISIPMLRALRREAAWSRHPDRLRCADSASANEGMADMNALIDAAIEAARRR